MEKHTLKIYDTEAVIYEIPYSETQDGSIKVEGVPSLDKAETILFDRQYKETKERKTGSYMASGWSPAKRIIVLAENINQKQLANILIATGSIDGIAYEVDINDVVIEHMEEEDTSLEVAEDTSKKDKKRRRK